MVRFKVSIVAAGHGGDMPGFLDMLRYEGGRVLDWTHAADGRYTVTIEVETHRHQPDRWASFGIRPEVVS